MKRQARLELLKPAPRHVRQLLREVLKVQGFIVIGFRPDTACPPRLGMETDQLFQFDMSSNFRLAEAATRDHWDAQVKLIQERRPKWQPLQEFPIPQGARFFKVVPAKSARRAA